MSVAQSAGGWSRHLVCFESSALSRTKPFASGKITARALIAKLVPVL